MTSHEQSGDRAVDRRAAIKKGIAAAATAGAVWSAPRIEGLTLRPDYASAQTGANQMVLNFTANNINAPAIVCGAVSNVSRTGSFISMQANGNHNMKTAVFNPAQANNFFQLNNANGDMFFFGIAGGGTLTVNYDCM